jgi:hypothetical protein
MAWVIRFHPEHGRSVLLYRDSDANHRLQRVVR